MQEEVKAFFMCSVLYIIGCNFSFGSLYVALLATPLLSSKFSYLSRISKRPNFMGNGLDVLPLNTPDQEEIEHILLDIVRR